MPVFNFEGEPLSADETRSYRRHAGRLTFVNLDGVHTCGWSWRLKSVQATANQT